MGDVDAIMVNIKVDLSDLSDIELIFLLNSINKEILERGIVATITEFNELEVISKCN